MENFYLINYINEDERSIIIFPDLAPSVNSMIDYLVPKNTKYLIIQDIEFIDFRFITAYKGDFLLESGSISKLYLNIDIAKSIFLDKIREFREPLFASLDIQFMRALEQGNTILSSEISAKKQELRDITQMDLSSATDLTSLKQFWPVSLLGDSPF